MPKRRKTNSDQLHGTLDMLVLKTLDAKPLHGYAIALRIEHLTDDVLKVEEGSLYPALYRMEQRTEASAKYAKQMKRIRHSSRLGPRAPNGSSSQSRPPAVRDRSW